MISELDFEGAYRELGADEDQKVLGKEGKSAVRDCNKEGDIQAEIMMTTIHKLNGHCVYPLALPPL